MFDSVNEYSKPNSKQGLEPLELVNAIQSWPPRNFNDVVCGDNLVMFKPRLNVKEMSRAFDDENPKIGVVTKAPAQDPHEKLVGICKSMVQEQVSRLQEELEVIDQGMRERLCERFGKGNEWRGLADRNLLKMCQILDEIGTEEDV